MLLLVILFLVSVFVVSAILLVSRHKKKHPAQIILLPHGGGLGNLLYMHNCAYALAKEHGVQLAICTNYKDKRPNVNEYAKLFQHVQMVDQIDSTAAHLREKAFTYEPLALSKFPVVISGYFQSYKYFRQWRHEIRDLLRANEKEIVSKMSRKLSAIPGVPVCVHIRRGDYVAEPLVHNVLPEAYYEKALQYLPGNCTLLVFAENTKEIKGWAVWQKTKNLRFVDDVPSALDTFFLMSMCRHFIVANSSLSLSAYELRTHDDSILVAPQQWFGPNGPSFKIRDLVDDQAIII